MQRDDQNPKIFFICYFCYATETVRCDYLVNPPKINKKKSENQKTKPKYLEETEIFDIS